MIQMVAEWFLSRDSLDLYAVMLRGGDTTWCDPDRLSSGMRAACCAAGDTWGGH